VTVVLAAPWNPRGELPRAQRMIADLDALYADVFIVVPPDASRDVSALAAHPTLHIRSDGDWHSGRHNALQNALASGPDSIHYCDFDRLLHWLECYPDELAQTVARMTKVDCLITGRTEQAWATHPRCMIETEILFNMTFSHLCNVDTFNGVMDFGAGSRVLSRRAAEYLMQQSSPAWGWAIDTAWPLLLHRAKYSIEYLAVNGLEWETPDQFRETAADPATRVAMAAQHDRTPEIWQQRVHVAHEVTRIGLLALERTQENLRNG
jgi:hypothetical protein